MLVEKIELRDGRTATTMLYVRHASPSLKTKSGLESVELPPSWIKEEMLKLLNYEIVKGDTYPMDECLTPESFAETWLNYAFVILLAGAHTIAPEIPQPDTFLGTFYIKPNYVGRCSHICNAGFLVNPGARGQGVGEALGKIYLKYAPRIGYTYSVFNLVFITNSASVKLWDRLGFDRIGLIKGAGRLKGHEHKVDAIMFGKELIST